MTTAHVVEMSVTVNNSHIIFRTAVSRTIMVIIIIIIIII